LITFSHIHLILSAKATTTFWSHSIVFPTQANMSLTLVPQNAARCGWVHATPCFHFVLSTDNWQSQMVNNWKCDMPSSR